MYLCSLLPLGPLSVCGLRSLAVVPLLARWRCSNRLTTSFFPARTTRQALDYPFARPTLELLDGQLDAHAATIVEGQVWHASLRLPFFLCVVRKGVGVGVGAGGWT